MAYDPKLKEKLVTQLWLPVAQKWGSVLYPRLRKNKRLKLLTLTSDLSFQEITKLEENELTERQHIVAWTHSHIKKWRLETEISPAKVFGTARYETCTSSVSFAIKEFFPFDMINLDFYSQDPSFEIGRVEKEIKSLEDTIKLQKETGANSFIMIYTTVLNSNHLDYLNIVHMSNGIPVLGWAGLPLNRFPSTIGDQADKMRCIRIVVCKLCSKYEYDCQIKKRTIPVESQKKLLLYSVALFANRG